MDLNMLNRANTTIIVIDGGDKLGKQTQSILLATNLRNSGLEVLNVEVPIKGNCFYSKIYEMLFDGTAITHPEMFQTFQVANRMAWQSQKLVDALDYFDVIIFDRWDVSSWIYGKSSGLTDDFIRVCNSSIIEPDFYYIFDGDPFPTPERDNDSYEANLEFRATVRENYKLWASLNPNSCKIVQANRDKCVIEAEILMDFKFRFPNIGQSES